MAPARPDPHGSHRWLDELEPSLRERLVALDEPVSREGWEQVVWRARRRRLRAPVSLGAAAVLAISCAALVLVLLGVSLPGGAGSGAAAPVAAGDGAAAASAPAHVASALLSDGNHTFYVSPSGHGGFCYRWASAGGGCNRIDQKHFWVTWNRNAVAGAVAFPAARFAEVKITFTDGTTAERHVAWMSAPLNAGFFVYEVPRGKTVAKITSGANKGF